MRTSKIKTLPLRLADSASLGYLLTMLILHCLPYPAFWVQPMPSTRGAVWVNFSGSPLLHIAGFLFLSSVAFLALWVIQKLMDRLSATNR